VDWGCAFKRNGAHFLEPEWFSCGSVLKCIQNADAEGSSRMLKKNKNAFLDRIRALDLEPSMFEATDSRTIEGHDLFIISLRGTPLTFKVMRPTSSFGDFVCSFVRFDENFSEQEQRGRVLHTQDLQQALWEFHGWLERHVKEYLDEQVIPDQWAELGAQRFPLEMGNLGPWESERFSRVEQAQIKEAIGRVELLIAETFSPSSQQLTEVKEVLEHVRDGVDRLGKSNFRYLLYSCGINIAATLALNPDNLRRLVELFKQAFGAVLGLPS